MCEPRAASDSSSFFSSFPFISLFSLSSLRRKIEEEKNRGVNGSKPSFLFSFFFFEKHTKNFYLFLVPFFLFVSWWKRVSRNSDRERILLKLFDERGGG